MDDHVKPSFEYKIEYPELLPFPTATQSLPAVATSFNTLTCVEILAPPVSVAVLHEPFVVERKIVGRFLLIPTATIPEVPPYAIAVHSLSKNVEPVTIPFCQDKPLNDTIIHCLSVVDSPTAIHSFANVEPGIHIMFFPIFGENVDPLVVFSHVVPS